MENEQSSESPATEASDAPKGRTRRGGRLRAIARAGRAGRRVAIVVYWVALLYMTLVGFITVIPQALYPETPLERPEGTCHDLLHELELELEEETTSRIQEAAPPTQEPRLRAYFQQWDDRFTALADCESDPAYGPLERLRYRYETTLRRFEREDRVLIERARAALEGTP